MMEASIQMKAEKNTKYIVEFDKLITIWPRFDQKIDQNLTKVGYNLIKFGHFSKNVIEFPEACFLKQVKVCA